MTGAGATDRKAAQQQHKLHKFVALLVIWLAHLVLILGLAEFSIEWFTPQLFRLMGLTGKLSSYSMGDFLPSLAGWLAVCTAILLVGLKIIWRSRFRILVPAVEVAIAGALLWIPPKY